VNSPAARAQIAAFLAIGCVGLYATSFGPALPFLSDRFDVSLDTAGLLITALFAGSISASAATALRFHGLDSRLLCLAGLALVTAGLLLMGLAPSWGVGLAGALTLGLGDGLVVAGTHALIAHTSEDVPGDINRLNVYFAAGALLGPLWAGGMLAAFGELAVVYAGISVVAVLAGVAMLRAPPSASLADPAGFSLALGRQAWIMGAVLFLYVGAEVGLGSWVSSYAREAAGAGVMAGAVITAGYWGALGAGRLLTGVLLSRGHESGAVLVGAIAGAGLASLVLAASGSAVALGGIAAFAAGLFFGPIWPLAISIAFKSAPRNAPAAMVTIGNAGGLVFPWVQGVVLVSAGASEGVLVTGALCAFMLLLAAAARTPLLARRVAEELP
jgi:fucose permease